MIRNMFLNFTGFSKFYFISQDTETKKHSALSAEAVEYAD